MPTIPGSRLSYKIEKSGPRARRVLKAMDLNSLVQLPILTLDLPREVEKLTLDVRHCPCHPRYAESGSRKHAASA
jgi:hypothetical protein